MGMVQRTNTWHPFFIFGLLLAFLEVEEARKSSRPGSMSVSGSVRKKKSFPFVSAPAFPLPPTLPALVRPRVGYRRSRNISTFLCLGEEHTALLVPTLEKGTY